MWARVLPATLRALEAGTALRGRDGVGSAPRTLTHGPALPWPSVACIRILEPCMACLRQRSGLAAAGQVPDLGVCAASRYGWCI